MSNGRQNRPHGPNIHLETNWNKVGDLWLITAIATVRYGKNGLPRQEEEVDLMIQGSWVDNGQTDTGSGMIAFEHEVPGPGRYNVRVQLTGHGGYSSKLVTISSGGGSKPKPAWIDFVENRVSRDKLEVTCQVLTKDHDPVPGARIRVVDSSDFSEHRDLEQTDGLGIVVDTVDISGVDQRHLVYHVLGSDVRARRQVYR